MKNEKIEANIQLIDSYIKESSIQIYKKNYTKSTLEMEIEVQISEIKKQDNELSAELRLSNHITINDKENNEKVVEINVKMAGIFTGNNLNENEFQEFIKYSGTPVLSQSIRAYVMSVSALSGVETIRLPMINFVEFFKKDIEEKNKRQ